LTRTLFARLGTLVWVILLGFVVALFVAAVPAVYLHLSTPPQTVADSLAGSGFTLGGYAAYMTGLQVLIGLGCLGAAVAIAWRRPRDAFVRLTTVFLALIGAANPPNLTALVDFNPNLEPLARLAQVLLLISLILFLFLFPDGLFKPAWARVAVLVDLVGLVVLTFVAGGSISDPPDVVALPIFAGLLGGGAVQVYRYMRTSNLAERQQTKWVVFAVALVVVGQLGFVILAPMLPSLVPPDLHATPYDPTNVTGVTLLYLVLSLSICLAILRYRLWDIDVLINRSLVYGVLSISLLGVYALAVVGVDAFLHTRASALGALIATCLVVVLVQPLHERLQRGVNRLLYGERDEPYGVLSRFGERLETSLAPDAVLPAIVHTVTEALKLPYAGLAVQGDAGFVEVARSGLPTPEALRIPLVFQHETVGELSLAARAPGETFSAADRQLLNALARQAAIAVHAVRLAADLERSRVRVVAAREEARRRLGSDLHDHLGHRMTGLLRIAETASNLLERDPRQARLELGDLTREARAAIRDVRELAHRLHPPELELLGLAGALRERAEQFAGNGLQVAVDAPDHLPAFTAAVEAAAYYIAQEALTNVHRHANATRCRVRLALVDDVLELDVIDDGRGVPANPASSSRGLGLRSMHERAAELGGYCRVEPTSGGGALVSARLPCAAGNHEQ
jgi:signal transduction histidine kinase